MDGIKQVARVRAVQQPAQYIKGLLNSLVTSLSVLPEQSNPVRELSELPPVLQKAVMAAAKAGQSWAAWHDTGPHVWLYVAQMSVLLSQERGSPVLQVKHYRETGLVDTCNWVIDREAKWHCWDG
jgi:hypothetical protein